MSDGWLDATGESLRREILAVIAHGTEHARRANAMDDLASCVLAWQRGRCVAVDRVVRAFAGERTQFTVREIPGVPTDAFKSARIACFPPHETRITFRTSGTTRDVRGVHELADTSLYEAAALACARRWLLPARTYRFVLLAESPDEAPHSSLSFMLALFARTWPDHGVTWGVRGGVLDVASVRAALDAARGDGVPVALLGATFAFVHLHDALDDRTHWTLPHGSVAMPTGGYKGRSRELSPDALFAMITQRFGLARTSIVQEYGMTELSSQAYEDHAVDLQADRYVAPPWMVVTAVDPVSLAPLPHGATGLLRLVDLANLGSCIAIQTGDLGIVHADGFTVLGRAPGATPRGCARAIDAVLAGDE